MKLWKCYACFDAKGRPGKGFSAPKPECPWCGASTLRGMVAEVSVIHFDPPSGIPNVGSNDAACNPGIRLGGGKVMLTGEPSAVTCVKCKDTQLFKDAAEAMGEGAVHAAADFPVVIDPNDGVKKAETS